ncbi:hypothetical protein CDAR_388751 [Caerostris darwini]|uniref:Uncharacterized protein n=1 Tax=Caerostris darwini TaxID=1538125 RepID=A0AAV4SA91_9ARAC|nr:hypothetical protein CDAR_388751 [Caerostris darwini]
MKTKIVKDIFFRGKKRRFFEATRFLKILTVLSDAVQPSIAGFGFVLVICLDTVVAFLIHPGRFLTVLSQGGRHGDNRSEIGSPLLVIFPAEFRDKRAFPHFIPTPEDDGAFLTNYSKCRPRFPKGIALI